MNNVSLMEIPEHSGLDTIRVYWHNVGVGKGHVTVTCWGCAWTAYFGGIGEDTIEQLFARADVPYLASKLGITQWLKQSKKREAYLERLIKAIKTAILAKP